MDTLGLTRSDFEVFTIGGFADRMALIQEQVRPKLVRLGRQIAPELERRLGLEVFPHVAKHARRTVNPPPETWCAFGPSAKGYKRYGYLALCVSAAGVHARMVVKPEADRRPQIAALLAQRASEMARSFAGTPLARYDQWSFTKLPPASGADERFWTELSEVTRKKTGTLDVGFGWNVREATALDRAELLDAYRELKPLYDLCRVA
jgi:uncharacterized protein YktB (UPF0637 family)